MKNLKRCMLCTYVLLAIAMAIFFPPPNKFAQIGKKIPLISSVIIITDGVPISGAAIQENRVLPSLS